MNTSKPGWKKGQPRTHNRLSALFLRNAERLKPGLYSDGGNLYLQVIGTTNRSWVFRFKSPTTGKIRTKGLGALRDCSLSDARGAAAALRVQVRAGIDPLEVDQADRKTKNASMGTFAQVAEACVQSKTAGWRSDKHAAQWRSTLANEAGALGNLPIATVTTDHVLRVLSPIWSTKTETASRLRQRIEAVLDYAKVLKFRTGDNPARWRGHLDKLLPKPSKVHKVAHQPALAYALIAVMMADLRARPGLTCRLLELVILTATRVSEPAGARWSEFDLDNDHVWTIPAERTKTDREHRVPLVGRALELLLALRADHDQRTADFAADDARRQFVFPGMKSGKHLNPEGARKLLQVDMGHNCTVHGFRSTFRDWCTEVARAPREVAEAALAHATKDKSEAAYARSDMLMRRRELISAWDRYCSGLD